MILKSVVGQEQAGMRLDDGVKQLFPQLSKGQIRRIIDWGGCTIRHACVRVASRTLLEGDDISIGVMEPEFCRELVYSVEELLYEDKNCLAINKAAGINCQRTPYQLKGTVEYAVGVYMKNQGNGEPARVIHRLDRGTSGVMVFPKNKKYAAHLSTLLKEGKVAKTYLALVTGNPSRQQWLTNAPIAKVAKSRYGVETPGRESQTGFKVIAAATGTALLEATPMTGRTHQIRVHLEHCGLPIVGDQVYGGASAPRMMLHCRTMAFEAGDGRKISITAPLDEQFTSVCGKYGIETAVDC
ncbi:MAG: RluA family pseudouridine synthase [Deltaproteobacteria bacterium]